MTEQEIWELVGERLERLSPAAVDELCHPDYALELPQSGERLQGPDNLRAFRDAFPDPPTIQPRRLVGADDLWVVEAVRTDQSSRIFVVAILEFRDGRIWRDTRWFADPLEAPAWRAGWVERFEEPSPGAGQSRAPALPMNAVICAEAREAPARDEQHERGHAAPVLTLA